MRKRQIKMSCRNYIFHLLLLRKIYRTRPLHSKRLVSSYFTFVSPSANMSHLATTIRNASIRHMFLTLRLGNYRLTRRLSTGDRALPNFPRFPSYCATFCRVRTNCSAYSGAKVREISSMSLWCDVHASTKRHKVVQGGCWTVWHRNDLLNSVLFAQRLREVLRTYCVWGSNYYT